MIVGELLEQLEQRVIGPLVFGKRSAASWRQQYGNLLLSLLPGGQFILLALAFKINRHALWLAVLAGNALISLVVWASAYRRKRVIEDTPTSKITSAPQGYVELVGLARQHKDAPLLYAPPNGVQCLWYRYEARQRDSVEEDAYEAEQSTDTFVLDDGGACVIDPDDAEIVTAHKRTWCEGNWRYTQSLIRPQDQLCVVGEFSTLMEPSGEERLSYLVGEIPKRLKSERREFIQRFDRNRDGQIDLQEWEAARLAAMREAMAQLRGEEKQRPAGSQAVHIVRRPRDGRPFLISNISSKLLARQYGRWAWLHAILFVVFIGALGNAGRA